MKDKRNINSAKKNKVKTHTIKNIFKSLISNQAAIDNRGMKLYASLIMLVLIVFIPWIPILSSGYTANGGKVFDTGNNFDVSTAFKSLIQDEQYFDDSLIIKTNDGGSYYLDMIFKDEYVGNADDENYNWPLEFDGKSDKKLLKSSYIDIVGKGANKSVTKPTEIEQTYYFDAVGTSVLADKTVTNDDGTTTTNKEMQRRVFLQMYYFPTLSQKDPSYKQYLSNFVDMVILQKNITGTAAKAPTSFCFVLKDYIEVNFYQFNSTITQASAGSYKGDLASGFKKCDITSGKSFKNFLTDSGKLSTEDAFKTNFVSLMDKSSRDYTIRTTWIQILTNTLISLGLGLISTLLLFFFYRRKTSIYKSKKWYTNLFEAFKTYTGLAFTPALLTMILTFFAPQMSTIALIGCNLIRVVFSMNKICPPAAQAQAKPVYQARS